MWFEDIEKEDELVRQQEAMEAYSSVYKYFLKDIKETMRSTRKNLPEIVEFFNKLKADYKECAEKIIKLGYEIPFLEKEINYLEHLN